MNSAFGKLCFILSEPTKSLSAIVSSIPFIIRVPWLPNSVGRRTDVLAEAVDMFRTLADLAGIPIPVGESHDVQGESLVPALSGAGTLRNYSFSQFAKSGPDSAPFGTCMGCFPSGKAAPDFMGFSVRSAAWRYTEWYRYNKSGGFPAWSELFASELYDHRLDRGDDFDSFENVNLVANNSIVPGSVAALAVTELKPVLIGQFRHDELLCTH